MPVNNPPIVIDGLIGYFDMANKRSWRGVPTQNMIHNGHFGGGHYTTEGGPTTDAKHLGTNTIVKMPNPGESEWCLRQSSGGATEYQLDIVANPYYDGTSWQWQTGRTDVPYPGIYPNTTYTISCWYAQSPDWDGAGGNLTVAQYADPTTPAYNSASITHTRYWVDYAQTTNTSVITAETTHSHLETKFVNGLRWERRYVTFTTGANVGRRNFNWYLGYTATASTKGYRYYTNLQMEPLSYATPYAYQGLAGQNGSTGYVTAPSLNTERKTGLLNGGTRCAKLAWKDFQKLDIASLGNLADGYEQEYDFSQGEKLNSSSGTLIRLTGVTISGTAGDGTFTCDTAQLQLLSVDDIILIAGPNNGSGTITASYTSGDRYKVSVKSTNSFKLDHITSSSGNTSSVSTSQTNGDKLTQNFYLIRKVGVNFSFVTETTSNTSKTYSYTNPSTSNVESISQIFYDTLENNADGTFSLNMTGAFRYNAIQLDLGRVDSLGGYDSTLDSSKYPTYLSDYTISVWVKTRLNNSSGTNIWVHMNPSNVSNANYFFPGPGDIKNVGTTLSSKKWQIVYNNYNPTKIRATYNTSGSEVGQATNTFTQTTIEESSSSNHTDNWYNVVFTNSSLLNEARFYVNGSLVGSAGPRAEVLTNQFFIGGHGDNVDGARGNCHVIKLYNRALTGDEVAQNFNVLKSRFGL